MDDDRAKAALSTIRAGIEAIAANIDFVLAQTGPESSIPPACRERIRRVFGGFGGRVWDLRSEYHDLVDELGLGTPGRSRDPCNRNTDPMRTARFIVETLQQGTREIDGLVRELEARSSREPEAYTLAYILVAETAVNILRAGPAVERAVNEIEAARDAAS